MPGHVAVGDGAVELRRDELSRPDVEVVEVFGMLGSLRRLWPLSTLPSALDEDADMAPTLLRGLALRLRMPWTALARRASELPSRLPVLVEKLPEMSCRQLSIRSPGGCVVVLPARDLLLLMLPAALFLLAPVSERPILPAPAPPTLPMRRECREKTEAASLHMSVFRLR